MSARAKRRLTRGLIVTLAVGGALVMALPFLLMVSTAFKPFAYVLELPPKLIPDQPTLDNFAEAWGANDFQRYFMNSLFVATISTVASVTLSSMLAFAFARYEFPGRRILFGALLVTLMVPGLILLIPQFVLAKNLGLLNSHAGLIVVYTVLNLALNVFLLRGFFASIPSELFDAAAVDGAGIVRSFVSVALPLARPGLAAATIFSFLAAWDEFTWALTTLQDERLYTLPIGIRLFQRQNGTEWGLVFAASLIALVPVVIVFVALQRHFMSGGLVGATKG